MLIHSLILISFLTASSLVSLLDLTLSTVRDAEDNSSYISFSKGGYATAYSALRYIKYEAPYGTYSLNLGSLYLDFTREDIRWNRVWGNHVWIGEYQIRFDEIEMIKGPDGIILFTK